MKICDQIRTTLLTDYIDDELDGKAMEEIEKHILACKECARLVETIKKDMSALADNSVRREVPVHLWQAIVRRIEAEAAPRSAVADLMQNIRERFTLPKLVPAIIGVALLIISVSFFFYTQYIGQVYGNDNFNYVSELFTGDNSSAAAHSELGTPIEEYFL